MMLMPGLDARGPATIRPVFSEPTTEEDMTMLRLRLAYLALASGVLMTLSGCYSSTCDRPPMFPNLFRSNRVPVMSEGDCPCQHAAQMPSTFEVPPGQGPFIGPPPGAMSGPILNPQPGLPPVLNKMQSAPPTAYTP
jgi:hypothetical protein